MGEDGKHFFYVNPLRVSPEETLHNPTLKHVKAQRPQWYGVACCPPNVARTITSLGGLLISEEEDTLYVLLPIACDFHTDHLQGTLDRQNDHFTLQLSGDAKDIRIRIPEGSEVRAAIGQVENGYLCLRHDGGKQIYEYTLTPRIRVLHAHPKVASDSGKVCVMRGLTVYCLEEADQAAPLASLVIPQKPQFQIRFDASGDLPVLICQGARRLWTDEDQLYSEQTPTYVPETLTFVPYCTWGNRGLGEMICWIGENH